MSVLDRLSTMPGVFWGVGRGPDAEFVARVVVVARDDASVTVDYEAWSADEGLQHAEAMRIARADDDLDAVLLAATSDGSDDTMVFREGESGVFGSTGPERVGLVLALEQDGLAFSWWWPDAQGALREQSHADVRLLRPIVLHPAVPGHVSEQGPPPRARSRRGSHSADPGPGDAQHADAQSADPVPDSAGAGGTTTTAATATTEVPWPGIVVLAGQGTGVVAQRLAERLTRAAVVRTDLFDKAVRGSGGGAPDPGLRHRIAVSVTKGYAASGHPVILHGASSRDEHASLVADLGAAGLHPVRLVEVGDGEDYGEVARRLIDGD